MKLGEQIASFRRATTDDKAPYLWSDVTITELLNEAQAEACIRGRLLHESINESVCQISVSAGTSTYPLHESLYELTYTSFAAGDGAQRTEIRLESAESLDRICPEWRTRTGTPKYAVQNDTTIRLVPTPDADGVLYLEGYRLPREELKDSNDEPEINKVHHRHLVDWALYRAFSIPDAESIDPKRASVALDAFTAYFGERQDSDLRRATRMDSPAVVPFLP